MQRADDILMMVLVVTVVCGLLVANIVLARWVSKREPYSSIRSVTLSLIVGFVVAGLRLVPGTHSQGSDQPVLIQVLVLWIYVALFAHLFILGLIAPNAQRKGRLAVFICRICRCSQ